MHIYVHMHRLICIYIYIYIHNYIHSAYLSRGDWKATMKLDVGRQAGVKELQGSKVTIVLDESVFRRFHTEKFRTATELLYVSEVTLSAKDIAVEGETIIEKEPEPVADPQGVEWKQATDEQMHDVYGSYVVVAAASLELKLGAGPAALDIMLESNQIVAKKKFQPKSLQIFPIATGSSRVDTKKCHVQVKVVVKGSAESQVVRLLQPNLKNNPTPFWTLHGDEPVKTGNMELVTHPYDLKVSAKDSRTSRMASTVDMRIEVPKYVNMDTIEEGDVLTIKQLPKRARHE